LQQFILEQFLIIINSVKESKVHWKRRVTRDWGNVSHV